MSTPVQKISDLEAQVASLTKERDAALAAKDGSATLTADLARVNAELVTANSALAAEKTEHGKVKVALAEAEAKYNTEKAAHDLLQKDFESKVVTAASVEAAKIVAGQNIPPVGSKVNNDPTKTEPTPGRRDPNAAKPSEQQLSTNAIEGFSDYWKGVLGKMNGK